MKQIRFTLQDLIRLKDELNSKRSDIDKYIKIDEIIWKLNNAISNPSPNALGIHIEKHGCIEISICLYRLAVAFHDNVDKFKNVARLNQLIKWLRR
jgi:hypothetical protein